MKLTDKSSEVFNYVKENGGRVSIDEMVAALGRTARSINANVTDLTKKGLASRDKVAAQSEDEKDVTYVVLAEDADAILAADAE